MADTLLETFKKNRIFSCLSDTDCERLLAKFSPLELPKGKILFYQGDPSDLVYLLVTGKLSAEVLLSSGELQTFGNIYEGETVGEMGALTNEPRSLTVRALRDSTLLSLPAADFIEICHQYPGVMFETLRPIVTRTNSIIQQLSEDKNNKNIVVIPANKDIILDEFSEKLIATAEHLKSTMVVSDYMPDFWNRNIDHAAVKEIIEKIAVSKKTSRRIISIVSSFDTPLARASFTHADMIYIVADANSEPDVDHAVMDKIHKRRSHLHSKPVLILMHPPGAKSPKNTDVWLAKASFAFHHHVRIDMHKDFQRLLRFMRGKAVGLVLSGGGTRGWAHLGVIKALNEAKVPIDIIGGTSAGAIAGACYALDQSYDNAYKRFYKIVTSSANSISWRSLTWPIISLFNARYFTAAQQDVFGDIKMEDLWLPYFCTSCNLTNNSEDVHRSGLLWEKLRATGSLPGIIPPMVIDGDIHYDGGLLNNLPVDVMRKLIGLRAKVIAVELNSFAPFEQKYDFPPVLGFIDAILVRFGWGSKKYKFPGFVDTFLRGLFIGAEAKAKQNALAANIYVSLDLSKYSLLHANPEQAKGLVDTGYEATMKELKAVKK